MYDYILQDKNRNMKSHNSDNLKLIGDTIIIDNKEWTVIDRELNYKR